MKSDTYIKAIAALELAHKKDPTREEFDGQQVPVEWLYANRLLNCLQEVYPNASEELLIAAYCQHLFRWEIKRSDYPEGKIGYYKWRNYLGDYQAEKAIELLKQSGYDEKFNQRVVDIMKKLNIHRIEESQMLEDAVCLVFLQYYMEPFTEGKSEEHLIQIVQKTWNKMSENGHTEALKLNLPLKTKEIVRKALA